MSGASSNPTLDRLRKLLETAELPALGPGPRKGVTPLPRLNALIDECVAESRISSAMRESIRAAVLLWHDHLDASHRISQDLHSSDGSYLHGIMHRREPDYGNAKYWFHRVGPHPCFAELSSRVGVMLKSTDHAALLHELLPESQWNPFAFVDACERASRSASTDAIPEMLRAIQAVEFELLLKRFCQV
jgi:hypothetical protein